ncbi:MAG: BamA/OMP85 family outer membrane protein [bacterium]
MGAGVQESSSDSANVPDRSGISERDAPLDGREAEDGFVEDEPKGPIVRRILWRGVEAFDESELEERIVTAVQPRIALRFWRPLRRLDEFTLEEDLDRIEEAYREIGYFRTEVDARIRRLAPDEVEIVIEVEEGPLARLQAWTLEIRTEAGEEPSAAEIERLRRHVVFESGEPFGSKLYRERRGALLAESGELGFTGAEIRGGATVEPEAGVARVDWTLDLGPRTFIDSIQITGLEDVDEEVVRRELLFEPGDRFSTSDLVESERRLVETGLFRSVVIGRPNRPQAPEREGRIDLEVRVQEMPARSLHASIGYGTEDGPRGEIGLDWRDFLGDGRRFQTRVFASFLDAGLEASLGQPYVFGDRARADFAVTALRQARPGYDAFVTGASGLLTLYPDRDTSPWSLAIGPGAELAQVTDFAIDVGEGLRGPRQSVVVNWFTILRYQRVDRIVDPRSGLRIELGNELGGQPIGSDLDYQQWHLDARAYRPMGPFVWAARVAATTLDPIGAGLSSVPVTRRLYSGGTNSIRGFGFQNLGPTDPGNDPIGGLSRIELGLELRVPVWKRIGLVGFVDAGDVRLDPWSWRPKDLRASAGPGLRIDTPIGPLRFDMGFLLNPPPETDPWRIHLSVGQAF